MVCTKSLARQTQRALLNQPGTHPFHLAFVAKSLIREAQMLALFKDLFPLQLPMSVVGCQPRRQNICQARPLRRVEPFDRGIWLIDYQVLQMMALLCFE